MTSGQTHLPRPNLEPTHIIDGEERPASIEIVEPPSEQDDGAADWRNNEFITD